MHARMDLSNMSYPVLNAANEKAKIMSEKAKIMSDLLNSLRIPNTNSSTNNLLKHLMADMSRLQGQSAGISGITPPNMPLTPRGTIGNQLEGIVLHTVPPPTVPPPRKQGVPYVFLVRLERNGTPRNFRKINKKQGSIRLRHATNSGTNRKRNGKMHYTLGTKINGTPVLDDLSKFKLKMFYPGNNKKTYYLNFTGDNTDRHILELASRIQEYKDRVKQKRKHEMTEAASHAGRVQTLINSGKNVVRRTPEDDIKRHILNQMLRWADNTTKSEFALGV